MSSVCKKDHEKQKENNVGFKVNWVALGQEDTQPTVEIILIAVSLNKCM